MKKRDLSNIATIQISKELQQDIRDLGEQLGMYGNRNVVRTLRHLVRVAEERPDFFHVLNKKRRFPTYTDKYATL
jgi:hypothetical protein